MIIVGSGRDGPGNGARSRSSDHKIFVYPTSRGVGSNVPYLSKKKAFSSKKTAFFRIDSGMFGMFQAPPLLKAGQSHRKDQSLKVLLRKSNFWMIIIVWLFWKTSLTSLGSFLVPPRLGHLWMSAQRMGWLKNRLATASFHLTASSKCQRNFSG